MNKGSDKFPLALHFMPLARHAYQHNAIQILEYLRCVHDCICYFKYYSLGVFRYPD